MIMIMMIMIMMIMIMMYYQQSKFITVEVGFAAEKRIPKHLVNEMLMKIGFFIKGRGDVLSLYMTPQCGDIIDILMFWTHPFGHK